MKIHQKIYWKVRNNLEVLVQKLVKSKYPKGALSHKPDPRDEEYIFEEKVEDGKVLGANIAEKFSAQKYYFNQSPFNICVFASLGLALSEQFGFRVSVRWFVKNAKRLGYITGDGFSYLRAGAKIATEIGAIPYELMPDETNGMGFTQYSEWTLNDTKLLEIAKQYRCADYKWIRSRDGLLAAIQNGYTPLTAGKWFSQMNYPQPPAYLLQYLGRFIGGHAYRMTGWSFFGKYIEVPQSFDRSYGDDTKAWLENPFNSDNQYGIYVLSKLPLNILVDKFKKDYQGWIVRTKDDPACYYIDNGEKRHVPTIESFWDIREKIGMEKFDDNVKPEVLGALVKGNDILNLN